jgi:hypothetical protein
MSITVSRLSRYRDCGFAETDTVMSRFQPPIENSGVSLTARSVRDLYKEDRTDAREK